MGDMQFFNRAVLLLQTNRFADAEQMLIKELTNNPNNAFALSYLAYSRICQDRSQDALTPARQAIALEPDNCFCLTMMGHTLMLNNQPDEAKKFLNTVLQIDPTYTNAYFILSQIEYNAKRWDSALQLAEQGLETDPEDQSLLNLRSRILVKLDRLEDASQTVDYALYNNPEDTYAHSNKGWSLLQLGKHREAVEAFKQALRFDPENEDARNGLKESIKAQNLLYRGMQKYFFFMERLSSQYQWLVVIGLYLGARFLSAISDFSPALKIITVPLLFAYTTFALATWIAQPLSNVFLRLHPVGKFALTEEEKHFGSIIAFFFFGGLLIWAAAWFAEGEALSGNMAIFGMTMLGMMVPLGGLSAIDRKTKAFSIMGLLAVLMLILGPLNMLYVVLLGEISISSILLAGFTIGIFLYGWIANAVISWSASRY